MPMVSCTGEASVNKPIRFVAPEQDCRDSAPRFYR
jgi:hypothetical protein